MSRATCLAASLLLLSCSSTPARPAERDGGVVETGDAAIDADGAEARDGAEAGDAAADAATCPTFGPATVVGHIADDRLAELSGLAASRTQPDILWAHGDNTAELFAVDRTSLVVRGHYTLVAGGERAPSGDLEDVAIGDGVIYLGDIGQGHRGNDLSIYRVAEPTVPAASVDVDLAAEVMRVDTRTLDDAETLLLDPVDGHLFIVEKDGRPHVCDVGPFTVGDATLHDCATRLDGFAMPSGGSVSADGRWIALRSETEAMLLSRPPGTPLLAAFTAGERCPIATLATPTNSDECNGEAIALSADGTALYTASERASMGAQSCPSTSVHRYAITR